MPELGRAALVATLGLALYALVAGAVAQLAGFGTAFATTALVVLLALLLWLRAPETRPDP